ncbi:PREDICTED: orofacial cleft 1 candidate gene 1 protein [Charadrius vociferus]|uniref:orofacial cleft 1 candidate gene 1 protein n=1 Tax=Charadrius vociferus TaxID=50402 RepID=UPI0005219C70|nr:PREDICTED: orofacial cleft 1 candidate gene 1 protein [Charadrius vociferus]
MEKEKFQQKALKQTKQKKSKSAEFLMVKEERAATEGIENPAFNISSTDLSAYQPSEEKIIRHDKPDSTLAAHQQKLGLQAHAEPRGNEYSRNYFDPLMDEEINPRQCGMEVSEEDPVKFDEQILYDKLMKVLDEENKMLDFQAPVQGEDFPDSVMPVSSSKARDLHRELEDEVIPSYIEQFERDVQDDIILLGSFSLEQGGKVSYGFLFVISQRKETRMGCRLLKTEENECEEEMVVGFGDLAGVDTGLNGAAGPCGKVDCSKTPQPIEIHIKCLRGVKDKVPKGHYTLKVSVLSRLGGGLLEWPKVKEQPQARTTRPISHDGNFYNTEIYFGQSIQTKKIFTKIAMAAQASTMASVSQRKIKEDITSCRSSAKMKLSRRVVEHFHFVVYAAFSELGAAHWRSRDFWLLMLLVVLLWFVRLYLHYLSQWLFLQTISVPVTKFQLFPHTVELCYQNSLLQRSEELVMVVVGPLTLDAGLLLMVLIRWGCQQLFDSFPSFLSKFIIALGLWTVLDPLAVFIVDSVLGRLENSVEKPIADAAKLYWVFQRAEESGIPGALITVILYIILFIISSTVLYLYFLRLHSEGWLLDVFRRIHGEEGTYFVPLDLEISNQELSYIMKRAEQWRGNNGERRMVSGEQNLLK